jgi:hypothetical protein
MLTQQYGHLAISSALPQHQAYSDEHMAADIQGYREDLICCARLNQRIPQPQEAQFREGVARSARRHKELKQLEWDFRLNIHLDDERYLPRMQWINNQFVEVGDEVPPLYQPAWAPTQHQTAYTQPPQVITQPQQQAISRPASQVVPQPTQPSFNQAFQQGVQQPQRQAVHQPPQQAPQPAGYYPGLWSSAHAPTSYRQQVLQHR